MGVTFLQTTINGEFYFIKRHNTKSSKIACLSVFWKFRKATIYGGRKGTLSSRVHVILGNWSTGTLPLQVLASCQLITFGY